MRIAKLEEYYNSTEYLEKVRARLQLMQDMSDNPMNRARLIMDVYSVDPIRFIEDFLLLKLPNYNQAIKPFFLFDYQKKIIRHLLDCENDMQEHKIVIDKPREMGVTWLLMAYTYWRWLFTPQWSCLLASRKEDEVDDGSNLPDKLFGKIRWFMDTTPQFLVPDGFQTKGKKGTQTDMKLKLINPTMQSSIKGTSTNTNMGRSSRYSMIIIDEAFFIEHFAMVENSLNTVARVQVYASSSKVGGQYDKFVKAQEEKGDRLSLTWKDHPWKDDVWYAEKLKEAERNPEAMREIEVNYAISADSQYYPQITQATLQTVEYDPSKPVYISLDTGTADMTVLLWCQYNGKFNIIEAYANKNREIAWYAPFMNPELPYNPDDYPIPFQKELLAKVRRWKKPVAWFGELDHFKKTMPTNTSSSMVLAKLGVQLRYNSYAVEYEPRRIATSAALPMTVFNTGSEYTMELYDAIVNSRYSKSHISPLAAKKPVHDPEIADYRSALENMFANLPRILRLQREDVQKLDPSARSLTNSMLKYVRS